MQRFEDWIKARDQALLNLDVEYAKREVMPDIPPEVFADLGGDEFVLSCLHKARYELTSMPPEARCASREWLEARGLSRLRNLPWSEDGSLPE